MNELAAMVGDTSQSRRVATIARRSASEAELTDSTCTPQWLTDMLPTVDFDPCSNSRSTVRAAHAMSLENGDDGLAASWNGAGFQNNPFSSPMAWMTKARHEILIGNCTGLIVLCKLDPGTAWWRVICDALTGTSPELWHFDRRIQYAEHPDVIEKRRLERIAKAVAGDAAKGIAPKPREWCEAHINGKSQANFNSVIIHHRGVMAPLKLESVATRWAQP